jgi:hypothetical protein
MLGIEPLERLVQQKQYRTKKDRPDQGQTLAFTPGKLLDWSVDPVKQAEGSE